MFAPGAESIPTGGSAHEKGRFGDAERRRTLGRAGDGERRQRHRQVPRRRGRPSRATRRRSGPACPASSARSRRTVRRSWRSRGDAAAAAAALNRSSTVEYAEPNLELHAFATPNDPRFGELYGLNNANDADMDAPEGWDAAGLGGFPATGGVKVGIVDTGIDAAHEDLSGKVVDCARRPAAHEPRRARATAPTNDHGTHVAGTIAAKANNGLGVAGVAFNSNWRSAGRSTRRLRHDRGRRELHHLPRRQGREGDLDVARRRRVHDAADRRPQRLEQRQRRADRRRGRQRRQRDGQLPGGLRRRSSASRRPTATTRAPRSRTPTPTSRSRPPASACSRPSAAAATSRSPARRWRRRTSPAWRR